MSEDTAKNLPAVQASRYVANVKAAEKMENKKYVDEFKAGELMIPWLTIVQTSSGFMKPNKPSYLAEARQGDIIDTLSRRLRATQSIIIVKYDGIHYTTWEPGGGKFVKAWYNDPTAYNAASWRVDKKTEEEIQFGTKLDGDGNEIKPAATYYILVVDFETGAAEPMTMAWGSTQIGKSKRINSLARADLVNAAGVPYTPPIFARVFDLGTKGENNATNAWSGWTFDVGGLVLDVAKFGEGWYAKAEAFREQIEKGNVRPMPPVEAGDDAAPQPGEDRAEGDAQPQARGAKAKTLSDDIPY